MPKKRSGCGIWLLFWIIIFLAVLLILLQDRSPFKETGIKEQIQKVKKYISKAPEERSKELRSVELYFIKHIERTDQLELVKVKRSIKATGTPLQDTLNLLLDGPSSDEEKRGVISVFWGNTKLKSVRISGNIAYLNFNPEIETGVGISMLQARLYQLVYTATQFPEVTAIKLLISGKEKKTFSSEGLSIRNPISRLKTKPIF
ncbi:MAG: GerMN domain-containing protein [Spirochaetes bacterium]|nr:GerMN domain-containing protein [Spirochaetota bacterium]